MGKTVFTNKYTYFFLHKKFAVLYLTGFKRYCQNIFRLNYTYIPNPKSLNIRIIFQASLWTLTASLVALLATLLSHQTTAAPTPVLYNDDSHPTTTFDVIAYLVNKQMQREPIERDEARGHIRSIIAHYFPGRRFETDAGYCFVVFLFRKVVVMLLFTIRFDSCFSNCMTYII